MTSIDSSRRRGGGQAMVDGDRRAATAGRRWRPTRRGVRCGALTWSSIYPPAFWRVAGGYVSRT